MSRSKIITATLLLGIVGLALYGISTVLGKVEETNSREYRIVIPAGTGEKLARGEDPQIIPNPIELVIGQRDILVIENQDIIGHRIGDLWVGPAETFRQEFKHPAIYEGECTIHKDSQIQIIVTKG